MLRISEEDVLLAGFIKKTARGEGKSEQVCIFMQTFIKSNNIYIYMDGRSRYNKVKKLLEPLVGQTLHVERIKEKIIIDIGASDACLEETLRLMIKLGLIQEVEHCVFKIIKNKIKEDGK